MAAYRTSDRKDRVKALAGVAFVHAVLAFVILWGLNVDTVSAAVERLKTFDITGEPTPPPVEPPPPRRDESSAPRDEAAPANIRSQPTPVVAPTPPIPLPIEQRITADVRGPDGVDRIAGAASTPGPGTGAGGQGSGFGGGGSGGAGAGDGRSPAVLVRNIPRSDYRRIGGDRVPRGEAGLALQIDARGRVSGCRVVRSSGDAVVDGRICGVAASRLRFRPARDLDGSAIPYFLNYIATWSPR